MIAEVEKRIRPRSPTIRDKVVERSNGAAPSSGLNAALAACSAAGIEVVSVRPEWIEVLAPCTFASIEPLQQLLMQFEADLPSDIGEAINYSFREMFSNAMEYGGQLDPAKHIEVRFIRLTRAVICRIKDPGNGFDPARLDHAAINNPSDDPLGHASVRDMKGLRPGGFGILLTSQLVDELVYNQRHNEVLFVKYLSSIEGQVHVIECTAC